MPKHAGSYNTEFDLKIMSEHPYIVSLPVKEREKELDDFAMDRASQGKHADERWWF